MLLACAAVPGVASAARTAPPLPDAAGVAAQRAQFLTLAELGLRQAHRHWWNPRLHWFDERKVPTASRPLVTLWGAVPLFQAYNGVAIANPTPANRHAAEVFALGAERYLNPALRPVAGFATYPGLRAPEPAWFDDNGWWGLSFMDAFRATGNPRFVPDAQRAFRFLAKSGWDAGRGGIWWDTRHTKKAGESLASATLLAALLYQQTKSPYYRDEAHKFIDWGGAHLWNAKAQLYQRAENKATPMPYVQSPMIVASQILCAMDTSGPDCARAAQLTAALKKWFPPEADMGPQFDAVYLRWLLQAAVATGDRELYAIAFYNAQRALANGRFNTGLFQRAWDGGNITDHDAEPGMLRIQGAGVSLLAWIAATPPPE